jgi:hypothetical protein
MWKVDLHNEFVREYQQLHTDVQDELLAHIELLEQFGPRLGRPRVDTLNASRHANMKELRLTPSAEFGASRLRSIRNDGPSSCAAATSQASVKSVSTAG